MQLPDCPKCFSKSAVTVQVDDGDTLHCPECDETFGLTDLLDSWAVILPWLKNHPARTGSAA